LRQMVHLDQYYQTTNAPRFAVTIDRLAEATEMATTWHDLVTSGKYDRLVRGGIVLREGIQERHGQERIHQFVRAIEALIVPTRGKTEKQFMSRCQTLGLAGERAIEILKESWDMRCDVEHLHSADRSLRKKYPENQWESIAHMRTRQMEVLARESYRRILTNPSIRRHFESDTTLDNFWNLDAAAQKQVWGRPIDVTGFKDDDREQGMIAELRNL